jgi:hypothetical protein
MHVTADQRQALTVVRLLCTNDFFGSYAPTRTSYGMLPGGAGLLRTIAQLAQGQPPTIWADAGDFAGGPLAAVSHGALGFAAANDLGIQVAALGNHEFDWGLAQLQQHAQRCRFPLLCMNADVGLPKTTLIPTRAGLLGFIGLTAPGTELAPCYDAVAPHDAPVAPVAHPIHTDQVRAAAGNLRAAGAAFVIVLLHDGVDLTPPGWVTGQVDPTRLLRVCRPWLAAVDAVVGGHTIVGQYAALVDGVAIVQPWAFGAAVGVIDLLRGQRPRVSQVVVEPAGRWAGQGADLLQTLADEQIAWRGVPLCFPKGAGHDLLQFAAAALRDAAQTDAALVMAWTGGINATQPPCDGVQSFLPSGPVSEADLLRLVPWPADSSVQVTMTRSELQALVAATPSPRRCAVAIHPKIPARQRLRVAMTAWMANQAQRWLGRPLDDVTPLACGLRTALRQALGASTT